MTILISAALDSARPLANFAGPTLHKALISIDSLDYIASCFAVFKLDRSPARRRNRAKQEVGHYFSTLHASQARALRLVPDRNTPRIV